MTADSERQIRELLETRTRAFGRRDAATAATGYDDDLVLYDVVGPFVRRGKDPTGRLERWIASYRAGHVRLARRRGQLRLRQPRHGDVVRDHEEQPHPRLRHPCNASRTS
jgi:hypothetical protein